MVKKWKQWQILFSWTLKSLWMVTADMKLKDSAPWKKSYDASCIKKQRHHFASKGLQKLWFSISQVWMWGLDHKEGWAPKNWCFWAVVLEKTLKSPLDSKEIQPVHPKGNQPWIFIGRTDAEAETPVICPPDAKSLLIGKTLMLGVIWGMRRRGWLRMRWLDGITMSMDMSQWTPGVGDRQGGLACCDSCGHKVLDTTEQLNWTELNLL